MELKKSSLLVEQVDKKFGVGPDSSMWSDYAVFAVEEVCKNAVLVYTDPSCGFADYAKYFFWCPDGRFLSLGWQWAPSDPVEAIRESYGAQDEKNAERNIIDYFKGRIEAYSLAGLMEQDKMQFEFTRTHTYQETYKASPEVTLCQEIDQFAKAYNNKKS